MAGVNFSSSAIRFLILPFASIFSPFDIFFARLAWEKVKCHPGVCCRAPEAGHISGNLPVSLARIARFWTEAVDTANLDKRVILF